MTMTAPLLLHRTALPLVLLTFPQLTRHGGLVAPLRTKLRHDGWEPQIDSGRGARRSAVAELVAHILEQASDSALESLESVLVRHLRVSLPHQHNHLGRVVIYGVHGEVLRMREVTGAEAGGPRNAR
jgi:hypothetical protein